MALPTLASEEESGIGLRLFIGASPPTPQPPLLLLLLFAALKDKEKSKMEFNEDDEASDGANVSFARLLVALSIMHVCGGSVEAAAAAAAAAGASLCC